jgi:hypothetical protein
MEEARREREVFDRPEGQALRDAAIEAVGALASFLEDQGVIWGLNDANDPDGIPRLKAQALVIACDYGIGGDIITTLKDGAWDRVHGNGVNPDPFGYGPPDIPVEQRDMDNSLVEYRVSRVFVRVGEPQ